MPFTSMNGLTRKPVNTWLVAPKTFTLSNVNIFRYHCFAANEDCMVMDEDQGRRHIHDVQEGYGWKNLHA
jgi:hypothetical protein